MRPKVSVVIPTYNRADLLPQTLLSAQVQSLEELEIIVSDDGSTDGTPELMKSACSLDSRIQYIRSEGNDGVSAARNRGIERAEGEYLQLLDSDDLLERNKLKIQVEMLEQNSGLDAVACQTQHFRKVPGDLPFVWNTFSRADLLGRSLETELVWSVAAPLYRRSVLERWGAYDESLGPAEDLEICIRQLAHGMRIGLHAHLLVHYRLGSPGSHTAKGRRTIVSMRARAVTTGAHHLDRLGILDEASAKRIAVSVAKSAWELASLGEPGTAVSLLREASKALEGFDCGERLECACLAREASDGDAESLQRAITEVGLDWSQRQSWWLRYRIENESLEPVPTFKRFSRRR